MPAPIGKSKLPRSTIGGNCPLPIRDRIDAIAIERGCSRSAVLVDALRAYISRADAAKKRETRSP